VGGDDKTLAGNFPPIVIVSGGAGASAEQVVHTVLAQFPSATLPVVTVANVRSIQQIRDVVDQVRAHGGFIVHTLVDTTLRDAMNAFGKDSNIVTIDLMGALFDNLSAVLGQEPLGEPGLYRQLNREYFERVAAIEFSMAHDDGRNSHELDRADMVLLGVSRVGKTPLSMYLSVLGWKVANVPFIKDQRLPGEVFEIERGRVIGLTIDPQRLINHRKIRHERIAGTQPSSYMDPGVIFEELEQSRRLFKQMGFSVIDISNKPLETSADEIIALISKRFGQRLRGLNDPSVQNK
jgi:regulator of PEP synthase PpsR (kinase-PPPase family)